MNKRMSIQGELDAMIEYRIQFTFKGKKEHIVQENAPNFVLLQVCYIFSEYLFLETHPESVFLSLLQHYKKRDFFLAILLFCNHCHCFEKEEGVNIKTLFFSNEITQFWLASICVNQSRTHSIITLALREGGEVHQNGNVYILIFVTDHLSINYQIFNYQIFRKFKACNITKNDFFRNKFSEVREKKNS